MMLDWAWVDKCWVSAALRYRDPSRLGTTDPYKALGCVRYLTVKTSAECFQVAVLSAPLSDGVNADKNNLMR